MSNFHHEETLNHIITELYCSGKIEQYTGYADYKLELSNCTLYFTAKRVNSNLSDIENIRCLKWIGKWHSSTTCSHDKLNKTSLLLLLDLIYPSI